jgi:flavorubredoxin
MVRKLDIKMIVPQHGRAFQGKAIPEFIAWIANLECGVDLMTQDNYALPK